MTLFICHHIIHHLLASGKDCTLSNTIHLALCDIICVRINVVNVIEMAELETDHTGVCLLLLVKDRNDKSSPKPTESLPNCRPHNQVYLSYSTVMLDYLIWLPNDYTSTMTVLVHAPVST